MRAISGVALLSLILSGCQASSPQGIVEVPGGASRFAILGTPNRMPVYVSEAPSISISDFERKAEDLGVSGRWAEDPTFGFFRSGNKSFSVHKKTGATFYQDDLLWGGGTGRRPDPAASGNGELPTIESAPDSHRAVAIARAFLTKQKINGLGSASFYREGGQGGSIVDPASRASVSGIPIREIVFKRSIDGRVLHGPASQISVFIGAVVNHLPGGNFRKVLNAALAW